MSMKQLNGVVMTRQKYLFSALLVPLLWSSAVLADCNTPISASVPTSQVVPDKAIYYNPDLKEIKQCHGSSWFPVENKMSPYNPSGYPYIGANGGYVVIPCEVQLGERCGGGLFAGDVNLIAAMPGCTDKRVRTGGGWEDDFDPITPGPGVTCPTDRNTLDFRKLRWADNNQTARDRWGAQYDYSAAKYSRRFGYANTHGDPRNAAIPGYKNGTNADVFKFCAALSVTVDGKTYNDWYVPSRFELQTVMNSMLRLGAGGDGAYVAANEAGTTGDSMDLINTGEDWRGFFAQQKTQRRPLVRCVRRN
jgi:hypothetical protein